MAKTLYTLILSVALCACGQTDPFSDRGVYTLYRSSVLDPLARVHVATFDASDRDDYNRGNCDIVRALFQDQPGVTVRYWCEAGRVTREGLTLLNNLRHNDPPIRPVAAAAPAMVASVIGMPWSIRSVVALLEQREGLG